MKKLILAGLVATCSIAQPLFSQSQTTPPPTPTPQQQQIQPRPMPMPMDNNQAGPRLTPEQMKQAQTFKMQLMKETLPLKNELREKEARLQTLRTSEKVDLVQINTLIDETSKLKASIEKKKEANMQEYRKTLPEDLRVQFDTDRKGFMKQLKARKPGKNKQSGQNMQRPPRPQPRPQENNAGDNH